MRRDCSRCCRAPQRRANVAYVLLAISVDLDATRHYCSAHGIATMGPENLIYERALPRLTDWARQRSIPLTWFIVGEDLRVPANAEAVAMLPELGHELGCHSYSHFYDLTRRSFAQMQDEVARGRAAVEEAAATRVTGFRAPGYVVNDTLLDLLREQEFAYDSSVFPCAPYYAIKLAAVARLRARGRTSASIIDAAEVLRAPTVPYRVGRPYWYRGTGIWEVPIQVTGRLRLPFIGTALTMAGALGARLLARGVLGQPFVNLELHAIDALDESDGLRELAKHQHDLRIPWMKKLDAIDAAVSMLKHAGYAAVRMDELTARAKAAGG